MTTTLPLYAFMTHIVTLLMLIGISLDYKTRSLMFLIAVLSITYFVSFLSLSDYEVYAQGFRGIDLSQSIQEQYSLFYGEYLYFYINYIFRFFTDDFNLVRMFLVGSALMIKLFFLLRWGRFYTLSFVFYIAFIFYADSYLLRSSLASSIVLIGIWGVLNNRPAYLFFTSIVIASTIHASALIALPIWFFRRAVISKHQAYLLLSFIFILSFANFGHQIVSTINTYFFNDIYVVNKLTGYLGSKYGNSIGIFRGSVVVYLLILIMFITYKKSIIRHMPHYHIVLNIALYSLFLLVSLSDFEILSDRLFRIIAFTLVIPLGYVVSVISKDIRTEAVAILIIFINLIPYITNADQLNFIN
jgi:hypothetical protein